MNLTSHVTVTVVTTECDAPGIRTPGVHCSNIPRRTPTCYPTCYPTLARGLTLRTILVPFEHQMFETRIRNVVIMFNYGLTGF